MVASGPQAQTVRADAAVIGGGVIGHSIAWELQRTGRKVVLIDDAPGTGASWAAAGMLAAVSEYHYQEEELLDLMVESAGLWPGFVKVLAQNAASATGYRTTPTLTVGASAADRTALLDLRRVQVERGLGVEPLTIREARSREPLLSPGISCALDTPGDHQVDPRLLVAALREALGRHQGGGTAVEGALHGFALPDRAAALIHDGGRIAGVRLSGGGEVLAAETIVANGLQAGDLAGLPEGLALPLRPVHGDILRLRVPEHLRPLLTATIRGLVHGVPVYIVPRTDGTVVIGATQREDRLAGTGSGGTASGTATPMAWTAVSAGGVYQLLRDAQQLVPAVAELELLEATARARPATADNAPLLGRVGSAAGDIPGLIISTGFFRHGVLLAPVAARICRELADGEPDPRWAAFRPDRFSGDRPPPVAARPSRHFPLEHQESR
ncbi:glycine oxidase ThiO [Pseudarthrobacter sp. J75]|uniref:glycine oxidase ThiO n=1 Tax=unclassified Pseudarthrobacter TaxID=2647000 RepID=UPI002E8080B1|nr:MULTISPECIES: glycine oxidase ThiO [unclassified Pseudarthrobacter]MEE2521313.1 glycine oxidase ThiO [Pseudarthrobacter sp. J47]MEE2528545.1 glycine oxidase ThiO [Pseudarthrobacter sp. J75]